jgi:hypothetical protein
MYDDIRNAGKSSSPYMKWCPDYHSAILYAMDEYSLKEVDESCECIAEAKSYNDAVSSWKKSGKLEMYLYPKWIKMFGSNKEGSITIPDPVSEECTGKCTPKTKYEIYSEEIVKIFADHKYVSDRIYKMPG